MIRFLSAISDLWQCLRYQWAIKQDGWHPDDIERNESRSR